MRTYGTLLRTVMSISILVTSLVACSETQTGRPNLGSSAHPTVHPTGPKRQPTRFQGDVATRVIDGDTIIVGNSRVRLVGIDAPDRGECGYKAAKEWMVKRVQGKPVSLLSTGTGVKDKYGRLLSYVEEDNSDVGFLLIRNGLAIAAYDSRTGYKKHFRESEYIMTDKAIRNVCPGMSTVRP